MTDLFLYQGATNPNDVVLRDPTTTSSAGTVDCTAAFTAPAGSFDVLAAEAFAATGDLTAPAGAWAASAAEAFPVTGDLTAPAGAWVAAASEAIGATGDLTAPAGAIAAIGGERFDAVGDLAAATGAIAAVASEQLDIVADLAAPVGAWSASDALDAIDCVGDWTAPAGEIDGRIQSTLWVTVDEPLGLSGGDLLIPTRRQQRPPVIAATASWAAPVGQWRGRADVSTEHLDREEAYLLGLIDLEEAA